MKKKKHGTLSERWPRNYVYFLSASVNQKPEYKAPVVYASLKILTQIEILDYTNRKIEMIKKFV